MVKDDEGALSRWSRRKAAARTGRDEKRRGRGAALPEPTKTPADTAPETAAEAASSASTPADAGNDTVVAEAPPNPADYGLPAIESLDRDSEYKGFLADGVPEVLTRAALRKLWASDPVFANLDGLNDYDEDFNLVDTLLSTVESPNEAARSKSTDHRNDADIAAEAEPTTAATDSDVDDGESGESASAEVADEDGEADEPEADRS
ncbi:MAG: DUF3306 domain-containing protein [Alphaproteobacteria bacterium]|jgi:hypothetical protein|nr:DUF3306 domain-containing protein [Alphaproteobacteria bacterium]